MLLFSFRVGGKSRENGEQREGGSNGGFIPALGMRHFSLAAGQQEAPRTRVQWASVARITT